MNSIQLFDISQIHQEYWKDFCDVCYTRFGFETNEERTYEQKYETFCRCKGFVTDTLDYEKKLLKIGKEDLERLHQQIDLFCKIRDVEDLIPTLHAVVSQIRTIKKKLEADTELIKYMSPRRIDVDFDKYHFSLPLCHERIEGDYIVEDIADPLDIDVIDKYCFTKKHPGGKISEIVYGIAQDNLCAYEGALKEMVSAMPDNNETPKGSGLQAFIYRLFMSFEDSLPEIKERLEELPIPYNLESLRDEWEQLIDSFNNSRLGERWNKCMPCKGGIQNIAKYFINHRNSISEKEEHDFFITLDKICIINDILQGNASKYWLNVEYPSNWLTIMKGQIILSETDQALHRRLLEYVENGDWQAPATLDKVKLWISTLFGTIPDKLNAAEQGDAMKFRNFFKGGRSGSKSDRVIVSMANILGYLIRYGYLAGGPQMTSEVFFNCREQVNNINKGRDNNASQDFKNLEPFLDKYRKLILN